MADEYTRDDSAYYARRAQREREMASKSRDAAIAAIHHSLADAYEGKLAVHRPQLAMAG